MEFMLETIISLFMVSAMCGISKIHRNISWIGSFYVVFSSSVLYFIARGLYEEHVVASQDWIRFFAIIVILFVLFFAEALEMYGIAKVNKSG